jgi:hypothetical protein
LLHARNNSNLSSDTMLGIGKWATITHMGTKTNTCTGIGNMQQAPYLTGKTGNKTIHI